IAQPMQFSRVIESYKLLPMSLVTLPALILPWVELLAGICLVSGICVRSAAMLLTALLLLFILALGLSALRGLKISCGCFSTGAGDYENIYWLIARDLLILIPGWVILFFGREKKNS
ncbi:MAG: DoxX family protein, partial [Candidatus Aminicenantes bacterium]|nr:DoxX family protein [Candidatus Aminicenantes bacterium]